MIEIKNIDYCDRFPSIRNFRESMINNISKENCITQIEKLYQDCPVEDLINLGIERLIENEEYFQLIGSHSNLSLLNEDGFELALHYNFGKPKDFVGSVLYSQVQDVVFCPIIDVDDNYKIYRQNKADDPAILNASFTLEPSVDKKMEPGKAIYLETFKDVLRLNKHKPFVTFMIKIKKNLTPYSWEYDSTTLQPTRIALAETNIGRLSTSVKILGQIGNDASVAVLNKFVKSNIHTVRWEAARAMINIDYQQGLSIIEDMAVNEAHEEVKTTAKRSLEILKQLN